MTDPRRQALAALAAADPRLRAITAAAVFADAFVEAAAAGLIGAGQLDAINRTLARACETAAAAVERGPARAGNVESIPSPVPRPCVGDPVVFHDAAQPFHRAAPGAPGPQRVGVVEEVGRDAATIRAADGRARAVPLVRIVRNLALWPDPGPARSEPKGAA